MNQKEILIFDEFAEILNNSRIVDLINLDDFNKNNKSNIPKLIKAYISSITMFDSNILKNLGINLKFVSTNNELKCFEAMSFPHSSLKNLVFENWDSNDEWTLAQLKKKLNSTFIFIPIIKIKSKGKYNNLSEWYFGNISVWKPSEAELKKIGKEWNLAKEIVTKGVQLSRESYGDGFRTKNNLLKQVKTKYIHLRPHGINSLDIDKHYAEYTNNEIEICKQSFWLNKKYINEILNLYRWKIHSRGK
jgi:DNA mismatch repair protein MutH